jgi:hypothetical protein
VKKTFAHHVHEKVAQSKTLLEFLTCDVSLNLLEHRPRVRLPRNATHAECRVVAPHDDSWRLYRAADGSAYYVQKEPDWWHETPWKKTVCVKLTPLEAIAWCADGDGDVSGTPQMRRDALRQLKKLRSSASENRGLVGASVHLVFGFTGSGTEYVIGVFETIPKARTAAEREAKKGRTTYVDSRTIR